MRRAGTLILSVVCAAIAAMWVYALFFASKEAVNKIGDEAWTQRADARCLVAKNERLALADYRLIDEAGPQALAGRATLVDRATDTIERMLQDIRETPPNDEKGQALIPLWIADYDTYVADRRAYAERLRAGDNSPFSETTTEGLPLSEKIATFAGDNRMKNCAPPIDLSV
ncbi:MAG: hypothetical protein EBT38_01545 [Acidimicrobiia bacterium]|nr:hypothetical protein [Acidimicrobiia bacterium]